MYGGYYVDSDMSSDEEDINAVYKESNYSTSVGLSKQLKIDGNSPGGYTSSINIQPNNTNLIEDQPQQQDEDLVSLNELDSSWDVHLSIADCPEPAVFSPGQTISVSFLWQTIRTEVWSEFLSISSTTTPISFKNIPNAHPVGIIDLFRSTTREKLANREHCKGERQIQLPLIKGEYVVSYWAHPNIYQEYLKYGESQKFIISKTIDIKSKCKISNETQKCWSIKTTFIPNVLSTFKLTPFEKTVMVEEQWWHTFKNSSLFSDPNIDIFMREGVVYFCDVAYPMVLQEQSLRNWYQKNKGHFGARENKDFKFITVLLSRGYAEGTKWEILSESSLVTPCTYDWL